MVVRKGEPCPIVEDGEVCGKPVLGAEMCSMHYARKQRHGDPLAKTRRYAKQGETCTAEEGCSEPVHALDLCKKHYKRETVHGETTDPRARKFWAQVNKDGPIPEYRPDLGPCWIWTGYIHIATGYGLFGVRNGTRLVHRIAYQYEVGPIGKSLHLDHLCRVRACCRPAHLEPVTPQENIRRGDQGAFWGYVPDLIPAKPEKPTVCTKCGNTEKPVYKSGLCRPCYRKRQKDPAFERPAPLTELERFWAKVDKTDSCWLWTGSVNAGTGYGHFSPRHGFQVQVHRYSYELANGPIPEKHDVHHTCHVRRCLNPAHLEAVTRSENLRMRKNRRD